MTDDFSANRIVRSARESTLASETAGPPVRMNVLLTYRKDASAPWPRYWEDSCSRKELELLPRTVGD